MDTKTVFTTICVLATALAYSRQAIPATPLPSIPSNAQTTPLPPPNGTALHAMCSNLSLGLVECISLFGDGSDNICSCRSVIEEYANACVEDSTEAEAQIRVINDLCRQQGTNGSVPTVSIDAADGSYYNSTTSPTIEPIAVSTSPTAVEGEGELSAECRRYNTTVRNCLDMSSSKRQGSTYCSRCQSVLSSYISDCVLMPELELLLSGIIKNQLNSVCMPQKLSDESSATTAGVSIVGFVLLAFSLIST